MPPTPAPNARPLVANTVTTVVPTTLSPNITDDMTTGEVLMLLTQSHKSLLNANTPVYQIRGLDTNVNAGKHVGKRVGKTITYSDLLNKRNDVGWKFRRYKSATFKIENNGVESFAAVGKPTEQTLLHKIDGDCPNLKWWHGTKSQECNYCGYYICQKCCHPIVRPPFDLVYYKRDRYKVAELERKEREKKEDDLKRNVCFQCSVFLQEVSTLNNAPKENASFGGKRKTAAKKKTMTKIINGKKRVIHTGSRGGKYFISNKRKIYIKKKVKH
jgi:hypothetical protein